MIVIFFHIWYITKIIIISFQAEAKVDLLRKQLSEASKEQTEQNGKFDELEAKLKTLSETNETLEKENRESKNKVSTLSVSVALSSFSFSSF